MASKKAGTQLKSVLPEEKKTEVTKKSEPGKDVALKYPKQLTKKDFSNKMKTLVLSCADIDSLSDAEAEVPTTVEILELGYNLFTSMDEIFERKLINLKYLGLAYNLIKSISSSEKSLQRVFPNLMHLDLSFNELDNLSALVPLVKTIANLRILLLIGNPLTFASGYRGFVLSNCQHLANLDEIAVHRKEMLMYSLWMLKGGKFEAISAAIKVNVIQLSIKPFSQIAKPVTAAGTVLAKKQIGVVKPIVNYYRVEYTWQIQDPVEILPSSPHGSDILASRTVSRMTIVEREVSTHSTQQRPGANPIEFNDVFLIPAKNCRILKRLFSTSLVVNIIDDAKGSRAEFYIPLSQLMDKPEIHIDWTNVKKSKSQENLEFAESGNYITINDGSQGTADTSNPITCNIVLAVYRQTYE